MTRAPNPAPNRPWPVLARCGAGLLLAAWLTPQPAAGAETLVGTWATPGRCGRPLSTIEIEPMGISGEDFYCDFDQVSRTGDTVRWRGTCDFGGEKEKSVVIAELLKSGRLRYQFGTKGWNGPLQRCKE